MNSLWDIRIFLGLVPKESPCILAFPKTLANELLRSLKVPLKNTKVPRVYHMFVTKSCVFFLENLTTDNGALKQGARYKSLVNKIMRKVSSTGNVTFIIKWYRRAKQWEELWNKEKCGQYVHPHTRVNRRYVRRYLAKKRRERTTEM
jgi:hypothetical protein